MRFCEEVFVTATIIRAIDAVFFCIMSLITAVHQVAALEHASLVRLTTSM